MEKNYLTSILGIGLIVVALLLAFNTKSDVIVDQNGLQRNTVSVSGTSSLTVDPNKAEIYVKVVTLEKTAQDAKNKNGQISKQVMDALKKEVVKDKDIETSQFNIYPRYEYEEIITPDFRVPSKQVLIGYEVTNVLKVTTLDLEKVGRLVDVSVDNGANDIESVVFGLTKEREKEVKQQAMVAASNDAREKAIALATNVGVTLLKPITVSESSFYFMPYASRGVMMEKADAAPTIINPQKLDISANVQLVYEIK
ncbi:SIMPL domain-containing protein [Candidatus Woesearchaeota archaeon]|nr:SIMPL domain-containing protein [Candidatus Woesearchaeota archaeon]